MYAENKMSKNPFLVPLKVDIKDTEHIISALRNIPKLGDKKIAQLLKQFPSLHGIATASVEQLAELLGFSLATSVWEYFNK